MEWLNVFCFFIVCIGFAANSSAQENTNRKMYIKAASDYRQELLYRKEDQADLMVQLREVILRSKIQTYKKEKLVDIINTQINTLDRLDHSLAFSMVITNKLKKEGFMEVYKDQQAQNIAINQRLGALYFNGIIEDKAPYKLTIDSFFLDQLDFYNVQNGEKIMDVGCGMGNIGFLLSMVHDSLDLYQNELNNSFIQFIEHELKSTKLLRPANTISIVKGKSKSTGVEDVQFDKVFLRISLHHFAKKKAMLKSIRKSLDHGLLYIIEELDDDDKEGCDKRMKRKEIEKVIYKSGFDILSLKEQDDGYLFIICQPSND